MQHTALHAPALLPVSQTAQLAAAGAAAVALAGQQEQGAAPPCEKLPARHLVQAGGAVALPGEASPQPGAHSVQAPPASWGDCGRRQAQLLTSLS